MVTIEPWAARDSPEGDWLITVPGEVELVLLTWVTRKPALDKVRMADELDTPTTLGTSAPV